MNVNIYQISEISVQTLHFFSPEQSKVWQPSNWVHSRLPRHARKGFLSSLNERGEFSSLFREPLGSGPMGGRLPP